MEIFLILSLPVHLLAEIILNLLWVVIGPHLLMSWGLWAYYCPALLRSFMCYFSLIFFFFLWVFLLNPHSVCFLRGNFEEIKTNYVVGSDHLYVTFLHVLKSSFTYFLGAFPVSISVLFLPF